MKDKRIRLQQGMKPSFHADDWITLTVASDNRLLALVRHVAQTAAELAGISQRAAYDVALAVNEACSNVIEHAYEGQEGSPLTLSCRIVEDGLELRVRDEGKPFDFSAVPDLPPEEIREGGRGVFLIRRLMDDVASSPLEGGGTELRMFKRRSPL